MPSTTSPDLPVAARPRMRKKGVDGGGRHPPPLPLAAQHRQSQACNGAGRAEQACMRRHASEHGRVEIVDFSHHHPPPHGTGFRGRRARPAPAQINAQWIPHQRVPEQVETSASEALQIGAERKDSHV